jgi:AraC-like DNA-binding protein
MSDPRQTVMLALLMVTAGAMLTMAAGISRAPQPVARWTGIVFEVSAAAYAIKLWNDVTQLLGPVPEFFILALSFGTVGWFWLFVLTLFEDRKSTRPILLVPVLLPIVLGLIAWYSPEDVARWLFVTSSLIRIGLGIAVIRIVTRSWKGDLVEVRRQLRGPFLLVVSAYVLALAGFDLWEAFVNPVPMFPLINSIVLAMICLLGSFVFIEAREQLFAPETAKTPKVAAREAGVAASGNGHAATGNGLDRAEKADLDRLEALMTKEEIWREEGLTIASLALRAGVPEAQLRRLINDRLGYRNFPSYVNAHRIACAKARLANPGEARVSVSTIAYDIGFASLGPFNRAFREETGVSPTEWRRKALNEPAEPSPIPEQV